MSKQDVVLDTKRMAVMSEVARRITHIQEQPDKIPVDAFQNGLFLRIQEQLIELVSQRDALLAALKRAEDALVIHAGHRAASVADIRSAIAAVATVESGK